MHCDTFHTCLLALCFVSAHLQQGRLEPWRVWWLRIPGTCRRRSELTVKDNIYPQLPFFPFIHQFFFKTSLYPYPVATAGIQLGAVSLLLTLVNVLQHFWSSVRRRHCLRRKDLSADINDDLPSKRSWIFGPHLLWKLTWCFPIGFLFGLKYGVTNLGLHLVPAPIHLLLQSTDLVWTVLGAWWINGERINCLGLAALGGCVAGSLCLGWQIMILHVEQAKDGGHVAIAAPLYAIGINLISPMLLGLCIATLRLACTELMRPDNRVGGTVSSVELTAIKLIMSSGVALVLGCFLEGSKHDGDGVDSWWVAFGKLTASTKAGVLGGSLLISVFQANCTFLTFLTSAVTVGLVGQVKIIPQWIVATIFTAMTSSGSSGGSIGSRLIPPPLGLLGALLICGSAAIFAYANYRELMNMTRILQRRASGNDEIDPAAGGLLEGSDGNSAFQVLSLRRSSSGGSAIMLSAHSLRVPVEGETTKPLLLVSDAELWGEASFREMYDELEEHSTTHQDHQHATTSRPSVKTPLLKKKQAVPGFEETTSNMYYSAS